MEAPGRRPRCRNACDLPVQRQTVRGVRGGREFYLDAKGQRRDRGVRACGLNDGLTLPDDISTPAFRAISGLPGDQYRFDARCKIAATGEGFANSRALVTSFAPATARLTGGGAPPSSAGRLIAACSP